MSHSSARSRALVRPFAMLALAAALLAPGAAFAKKKPAAAMPPGTPERAGAVLVTVNGQPITQGMVDTALTVLPEEVREQVLSGGMLGQLQEKLVLQELLWQEAITRGLTEDAAIRAKMVMAQRDVLATAVLEAEAEKRSNDSAVKAFYDSHPEIFQSKQVHARHILVADEAKAKELFGRAKAGEDFGALARANSQDPGSAPAGGDLGWFEKGRMVPEFEAAAFGAEAGQVVGPVKTSFGWHVLQVLETRTSMPFEEVRDTIRAQLRDEAGRTFLEELRGRASVVPAGPSTQAPAPTP